MIQAEQHRFRLQRTRLQLLDDDTPQFESLVESRDQYVRSLEETIDLLKRDDTLASQNNLAMRNSMNDLMAMQQLSNTICTSRDLKQ